jgi:3'-phosphoadenosine 5'-phosphosulfate sulfotransferase (PAPS reductase)/FAD synthetase
MSQERNIISISGGKDSTALLLLAIEQQPDNMEAVFCDTGNEHQLTYEYVKYLEARTGVHIRWVTADFSEQIERKRKFVDTVWREQGVHEELINQALAVLVPTGNPFLDLCVWKGRFPSRMAQFCTEQLKKVPFYDQVVLPYVEADDEVIAWQGVRRDESVNRRHLAVREQKSANFSHYRPLLDWNVEQVFEQHRKHGVEPNPLYKMGMGRVGCMPCINCAKNELLEISKRFPEAVERIKSWEFIVGQASKRGFATFFAMHNGKNNDWTAQEYFENGNISRVVEWSKTSRGGKQYNLFRMEEQPHACTSMYGLCE